MPPTLNTEDDLFRILKRPDIHAMVVLHRDWVRDHRDAGGGIYDQRKNLELVKLYGWDWIEFLKARHEAGYSF